MRKQYHFRNSDHGLLAWDVDRLITLTKDLPTVQIQLDTIRELDEPFWFSNGAIPTCRAVADHARLMQAADLGFPIILSSDGRVMDGMHRVAKATLLGQASIKAVMFLNDPEPDYVGVHPDELPYDESPGPNITPHSMTDQPSPEIELLRAAYAAFNARDIDAALALMTPDVAWPRAFKGGFVQGPQAIRAYWTEQWSEINPHVEPVSFHPESAGRIWVEVRQVVRDLTGAVLADEHVGHRFTMEHSLIQRMEVCASPVSDRNV